MSTDKRKTQVPIVAVVIERESKLVSVRIAKVLASLYLKHHGNRMEKGSFYFSSLPENDFKAAILVCGGKNGRRL